MILKRRAVLGWGPDEDKHVTILNRMVDLRVINGIETLTYEPDPSHIDLVVKHLGLERARGVDTPGEKQPGYSDQTTLNKQDSTLYRSCTMRCSHLAADVPALQFSSNRLARGMNQPTVGQMM